VILVGCAKKETRGGDAARIKPVVVQTVTATVEEWDDTYASTGTVQARTAATVASKVTGYVQRGMVQTGDRVSQGQVLVLVEAAQARRGQLRSRLEQAEQEQRGAGILRDYARLTAPFAGIVSAKTVNPGDLATPGVPLLRIESTGSYRLEALVDESKLSGLRV